jgi:hypothetical protein
MKLVAIRLDGSSGFCPHCVGTLTPLNPHTLTNVSKLPLFLFPRLTVLAIAIGVTAAVLTQPASAGVPPTPIQLDITETSPTATGPLSYLQWLSG